MSRVGLGNNMTQPNKQCLNCKEWQPATKRDFFGFATVGKCKAGYCKKNAKYGVRK